MFPGRESDKHWYPPNLPGLAQLTCLGPDGQIHPLTLSSYDVHACLREALSHLSLSPIQPSELPGTQSNAYSFVNDPVRSPKHLVSTTREDADLIWAINPLGSSSSLFCNQHPLAVQFREVGFDIIASDSEIGKVNLTMDLRQYCEKYILIKDREGKFPCLCDLEKQGYKIYPYKLLPVQFSNITA